MMRLSLVLAWMALAFAAASATVEGELQERLRLAQKLLSQSEFAFGQKALQCSCDQYCTGQCFAPQCAPCDPIAFSFPGGASLCLNPYPLGEGLLCAKDVNGTLTQNACCSVGGATCQLPPDGCCASGGCDSCPTYPPMPSIFPPLNRTFINDQCIGAQ